MLNKKKIRELPEDGIDKSRKA